MRDATREALVSRLSDCGRVVEIGVGNRPSVAAALVAWGVTVTATDIRERTTPAGVGFVCDDVTDPEWSVYAGADALYALNLPPELQRPAAALADGVGAPLFFTTLGGDPVLVSVDREPLPAGTLYLHTREGPTPDHGVEK